MAKEKATKKVEEAPVEEKTTASEGASKPSRPVRKDGNKITVTLPNGTARVYSPATHGKMWEVLANNFAEANDGAVVEVE